MAKPKLPKKNNGVKRSHPHPEQPCAAAMPAALTDASLASPDSGAPSLETQTGGNPNRRDKNGRTETGDRQDRTARQACSDQSGR